MTFVEQIGLAASVSLPLWNIPLIVKIVERRSSADISMSWVMGVWTCSLLMLPSGLLSKDIVLKAFSVVNILFFTGVMLAAVKYRKGCDGKK